MTNQKTSHDGLVGKFCHRHKDAGFLKHFPEHRYVNNQGIIASVTSRDNFGTPTAYEVQWFSTVDGYPTNSEIILSEQMLFEQWSFYGDEDKWRQEFDKSMRLWNLNRDMIDREEGTQ